MSLIPTDNGDGTVTFSDSVTGKVWPPIAKSVIADRKAASDARRAALANAPDPLVQKVTDILEVAGLIDSAKASDVQAVMQERTVVVPGRVPR